MWGLSESLFTRREEEAEKTCKYSDEEKSDVGFGAVEKETRPPRNAKTMRNLQNVCIYHVNKPKLFPKASTDPNQNPTITSSMNITRLPNKPVAFIRR